MMFAIGLYMNLYLRLVICVENNIQQSGAMSNNSFGTDMNYEDLENSTLNELSNSNQLIFNSATSYNSGLIGSILGEEEAVFDVTDETTKQKAQPDSFKQIDTSTSKEEVFQYETNSMSISIEVNNLREQGSSLEESINNTNWIHEDSRDFHHEVTAQLGLKVKTKENLTEEIPSFSEWAQKQLEQAEKNKDQPNSTSQGLFFNGKSAKTRSKNYASPDCGAKIIAANPESISPGSVLSTSRDEYKLNKCTSRIWFIVELCEAIQAKKVDLANFELFSSSPRDFSIFVSDRFPTRDWSNVGHFTAKDERDIQNFDLHPYLFGKYVKFEMHSHYGSEHYCPISLFRVYGTSEFEVLDTEDPSRSNNIYDEDNEDDEGSLDFDKEDIPKNLLTTATDAVISIVRKAAQVLGTNDNIFNQTTNNAIFTNFKRLDIAKQCVTPAFTLICPDCMDIFYSSVYNLLSCEYNFLQMLISYKKLIAALKISNYCSNYGLNFLEDEGSVIKMNYSFLKILPLEYVTALCNILAALENKVVYNSTVYCSNCTKNLSRDNVFVNISDKSIVSLHSTKTMGNTDHFSNITKKEIFMSLMSGNNQRNFLKSRYEDQSDTYFNNVPYSDKKESSLEGKNMEIVISNVNIDFSESTENFLSEGIDSQNEIQAATVSPISVQSQNKESLFVRLTNRIKTLEQNMSLSSQYLEELSKRYKKQVEEMQRLLDKAILHLSEENIKKDERTEKLENQLAHVMQIIDGLLAERRFWIYLSYWILLTFAVLLCFYFFCGRNSIFGKSKSGNEKTNPKILHGKPDIFVNKNLPKQKRRYSGDTLKKNFFDNHIFTIDEPDKHAKKEKSKKKKKSSSIVRSKSVINLIEETNDKKTIEINNEFSFVDSQSLTSPNHIVEDIPSSIQDISFVLDESEFTTVDPFIFDEFGTSLHIKNDSFNQNSLMLSECINSRKGFRAVNQDKINYFNKKLDICDNENKKILGQVPYFQLSNVAESKKKTLNQKNKNKALKKILQSFSFKHKVDEIQNY